MKTFLLTQWERSIVRWIICCLLIIFIIILFLYFFAWRAPADFPQGSLYTIDEGSGLSFTAQNLYSQDIIRSKFWFKSAIVLFGGLRPLKAGDYALAHKQNIFDLAYRFSHSDYELVPIRITIQEGLNVFEIADLLINRFSKINKEDFVKLAYEHEGYLFPDTYYFLPNSTAKIIITAMTKNFTKQISTLDTEINNFSQSFPDIIKMASIVEKEASDFETRQIIAGILWKRIAIDMPLQVDVSFKYINNKVTEDLTLEDLKLDSPYNSYLYTGLPPTPISNPGLEAIQATITPIETDYLYFLADGKGETYYAKNHVGHLQNKKLYLN